MLDDLRAAVKAEKIKTADELLDHLKTDLVARLDGDRTLKTAAEGPTVWLMVGVNGVGKTTTIGKLARRQVNDGKKVMLAAGDTFRAAAGDQLQLWAERTGADIIRGAEGADPGFGRLRRDRGGRRARREHRVWPTPPVVCTTRSTSWRNCARCTASPSADRPR